MSTSAEKLRYVVLHHTGVEAPHLDLMFETAPGSMLRTYRLPQWPVSEGDVATALPAHRREYLHYQGPVSNDRGSVERIAEGVIAITHLSQDGQQIQFCFDGSPMTWTLTTAEAARAVFSKLDDSD